METVRLSMNIKRPKGQHWSKQCRVPQEIKNSREIEKFKQDLKDIKDDSLARVWGHRRRGIGAHTLVLRVRKSRGKIYPVGVDARNRGFSSLEAVKAFAKSIGRDAVRMGAILTPVAK